MGTPGPQKTKRYSLEFKLQAVALLVGAAPAPEPEAVAELQRLRKVERQFKKLQQEHDLLKMPFGLFPNEG